MTIEKERRRAIDAISARALFDGSVVPLVLADDEHRYVDANDAALTVLGLTRDELLGRRLEDLATADLARRNHSTWSRVGPNLHLGVVDRAPRDAAASPLSAREREILSRVALGQDGPEIAAALVVSPATVRTHIGNAVRKLGARSRAHAVAVALRSGLLDDGQLDR
jgi:DNA-binding CsgD family transcriptional regulator